jgi:2-aminoethylphosphonate-pyruvate transaminase
MPLRRIAMSHPTAHAPILLTPGPLTTRLETRQAMMQDWGSWDQPFNALTAQVCSALLSVVHGEQSHVCIPMQGSGTFAVEAALGTLIARSDKVLVPVQGAYCERIVKILTILGKAVVRYDLQEDQPVDPEQIANLLSADQALTHVALVHCETTTGLLNPLEKIAAVVERYGRQLIVDAMSTFGALPIDLRHTRAAAVISASGKCLEGVPGMGFVIADLQVLQDSAANSHSLALDLHDQWQYMQATKQWRYTPPTHVVAALHAALELHAQEGGVAARAVRYQDNCSTLIAGMRQLGFVPYLREADQAPIITTFHAPQHPAYDFPSFYQLMREKGFVLYPGKLTRAATFRIGCIGAISRQDITRMLHAVRQTMLEMGMNEESRDAAYFPSKPHPGANPG